MKKFITTLVSLALFTALLTPAAFAWESITVDMDKVGVDVGASDWATDELKVAGEAGLVPTLTGNPGFQSKITREQFAELAVNMVSVIYGEGPDLSLAKTFTDCDNPAVLSASAAGIVDGVGNGKFAPTATITREQIAVMLYRAIGYLENGMEDAFLLISSDISVFSDKDSVSDWATEGVGALAANEIMKGTSSTALSPQDPCTVEQSILLVYRIYTVIAHGA